MLRRITCTKFLIWSTLLCLSVPLSAQAKLKLSGFVDTGFLYENARDTNTFRLHQVELDVDTELNPWASMRFDFNFSADASGAEVQAGIFDSLTADEVVEQGFIQLKLPTEAYGFESFFSFGKRTDSAPTPAWELVEPMELLQASSAHLTLFGVPLSITGAFLTMNFGTSTSLSVYVVNGWDNATDNNKMKTVGGRIDFSLFDGLAASLAVISGPEQDNNDDNYRTVIDTGVTLTTIPKLLIGAEFLYGHEEGAAYDGVDATWIGGLLTLHYTFTDILGLTFRFDAFDDSDGARLPPDNPAVTGERRYGLTLAPVLYLAENMRIIFEARLDHSNEDAFRESDTRFTDKLFTAAVEFTYTFDHEVKLAAKTP